MFPRVLWLLTLMTVISSAAADADDPSNSALDEGAEAIRAGKLAEALKFAEKAVAADPKSAEPLVLRASIHAAMQKHAQAVADYDAALAIDSKRAELYDARGSEQFMLGKIDESIRDFDKFLELRPNLAPHHWKRGISYYYAGRYDEGRKQFEAYQTVDDNDVENVVWRQLCMSKSEGPDKARRAALKVRNDARVPMMRIYDLFIGKASADDVLKEAAAGNLPRERRDEQEFYAHLYIGLHYEAQGDARRALEHISKAARDYKIGHYMWHVARVHAELREKESKKESAAERGAKP
jgi:lipoprotein NlpI